MKISVILLTWNSEKFIKGCIDSTIGAVEDYDYEIIIIDNHSTDCSKDLIKPYLTNRRIKLFEMSENMGVAGGRNFGIKQSSGDLVWLLDIDTVTNTDAVRSMVSTLQENPDCGICGCKLIHSSGEVQNSCRKLPRLRYKILNTLSAKMRNCKRITKIINNLNAKQFYTKEMNSSKPFEAEYIIGACQMIRKTVIEKIGMLDEAIFYGPEDADYCLRARKAGWKTLYIPTASFIHEYQRISNKRLMSQMGKVHIKALLHFWWKHKII